MRFRTRGDMADFDCSECFRRTSVTVKDEVLETYFCAYCGRKELMDEK